MVWIEIGTKTTKKCENFHLQFGVRFCWSHHLRSGLIGPRIERRKSIHRPILRILTLNVNVNVQLMSCRCGVRCCLVHYTMSAESVSPVAEDSPGPWQIDRISNCDATTNTAITLPDRWSQFCTLYRIALKSRYETWHHPSANLQTNCVNQRNLFQKHTTDTLNYLLNCSSQTNWYDTDYYCFWPCSDLSVLILAKDFDWQADIVHDMLRSNRLNWENLGVSCEM